MFIISKKIESVIRYLMIHFLSDKIPLYIINEYPKSGGTWLGQMLSKALDVPFPRNQMPKLCPSIMHCHFIEPWGMNNIVIVWRDGRDIIISWYYYCFFKQGTNDFLVDLMKRNLNYKKIENIKENLPSFIEFCFTKNIYPRFSWTDFVETWFDKPNVVYTRYEDLHVDAVRELQKIVAQLIDKDLTLEEAQEIVDYYSFRNQSGRNPGVQKSNQFLRKGIVGDWKNYFTKESAKIFDHFAGDKLILLKYEKDKNWIENMS